MYNISTMGATPFILLPLLFKANSSVLCESKRERKRGEIHILRETEKDRGGKRRQREIDRERERERERL